MSEETKDVKTHAQTLAAAAAYYSGLDWKILPCHGIDDNSRCTCGTIHAEPKDVGKHPAIGEWNVRATSDPVTTSGWWNGENIYNIGVFCQASGFFVIDIDPRSGGDASYAKFESQMDFDLPKTVEALTGSYKFNGRESRGRHLYFKFDPRESLLGNLNAIGLKGIDIKSNGYIMIAPSRHGSGVNYDWAPGHAPWEIEMAEAPEELLELLRKRTNRSKTTLGTGNWDFMEGLEYNGEKVDIETILAEGIEEGSRAVDIYKLTCALANKFGVNNEAGKMAVETMMIRFNAEKVRPPLELEGQGGLLMHVRRAIDFVESNPVADRLWPGAQEWANRSQDEARTAVVVPQVAAAYQQAEALNSNSLVENDFIYAPENLPGTIGGAITAAAHSGVSISEAFSNGNVDVPRDPDAISEAEGGEPGKRSLSDIGNGRRIVDSFGSSIRYTPGMGWFIWDGQYWKPDSEALGMQELAKRIPPIIATEVAKYEDQDKKNEVLKWATQAKAVSRLKTSIETATSDPRTIVSSEAWDSNADLFGVFNGVIDLKTGDLIKGRPELHITKRSPVAYTPGMRNVRWEQFLDFATGGDKEFQDWLQRAVGYTLTGHSNQDVLFLVYGPGGTGKNTFVESIFEALNSEQYSTILPSAELAAGNGITKSSSEYYMAGLRGKRMIWVDELPESERINENQVKALTGSSTLSGRDPGGKPFSFKSQGKLWITTNHRPIINDEAMWRRLRPIPWVHKPDPERSSPDLKAYLADPEGGLPAILSWAVEGAIKYLNSSARDPLGWCAVVKEAAEVYRKNEDRMGMFLDEETKENEGVSVAVQALYNVYRVWSEERGEKPMTTIGFTRKLTERGIEITGQGSKAELHGRVLNPRVVPSGEVDWSLATRMAKF